MSFKKLTTDLTNAIKNRETQKANVLKLLKSAVINELVAQGGTPRDDVSDETFIKVIRREAKKRKESIEQYKKGNRGDLAEQEEFELKIINDYLPSEPSDGEILNEVKKIIEEEQIPIDQSGRIIGATIKRFGGSVSGNRVREIVEKIKQENN